MKPISFTFILFIISLFSVVNAQILKPTLINDNLDELFLNRDNSYRDIAEKTVENHLSENLVIYYYEIVYHDKVIFREGIPKTTPKSKDTDMMSNQFRFKYKTIYLDASLISDSDKLLLLESKKVKLTTISGKKLIEFNDSQIIKKDYESNKYLIVNLLDNMKINIYKVNFE